MKIIDTTFERLPRERLEIGFKGENLRATVRIDCASVFAEYPNATPTLIVKPLFADAYPVVVDRNGTCVDWLITSEILSFNGDGEIQLVFYKDQVICKSAVSKIRVSRSLQVTGEMPDPVVQWIEDANRKLAEVDAQIVELEGMVDTATDAATRAEQSASTASTKAEQAAGSAATATAKATEAQTAAGTATAKAAEAEQSALTATEKATAAAESERIATAKAGDATTAAGTATAKAEQATEAAQTATEKAGDASASARAAQTSAIDAASSATAASASETAAKASETAASTSATQAAQSAQTASTAAQTATQKAAEATQSATNAATFAGTATTKAEEAAQSAQAASDAKTAVEQTAEQLADSLEQISQNTADIAEHEQAYNALKEATLIHNTASGAIASFVDGAEMPVDEVTAQINPVQDLHGYDSPWPAGGGKNKLPNENGTYKGTTGNNIYIVDSESPVSLPAGTYYIKYFADKSTGLALAGFYLSINGGTASRVGTNHATQETVESFVLAEQSNITLRLYSSTTGFNEAKYRFMLTVEDSTNIAFSPYANICPISGFEGLTVTRTGKNMINPSKLVSGGNNVWYGIHLPPDTDFVFSTDSAITGLYVAYSDADEMPSISRTGWTEITYKYNTTSLRFNSGSHKWYRLMTYEINGVIRDRLYQLELGTTATAYEPYQGETYEVEFPSEAGTVYGGSLTIAEDGSGVLTVDRALVQINGTETLRKWSAGWASLETNGVAYLVYASSNPTAKYEDGAKNVICDILPSVSNIEMYYRRKNEGVCVGNGNLVAFLVNGITEMEDMRTYLSTNKPTVCYKLLTSTTYTLTAPEITTLLGENNLWHDANGDISVGYKANTKLYIDNKIAELVARIVNS